jgi:molybdopterin synthase catalytic subunit
MWNFKVTGQPLDPRALEKALENPENGGVVTFLGVVRRHSLGKEVSYLEYEAYEPMCAKIMARIAQELAERWDVQDVGIWHRTGRVEIGEASLLVVTAYPHRKEAFEAAMYCVDRIKEILPVWKKEVWTDGESWVEGSAHVSRLEPTT